MSIETDLVSLDRKLEMMTEPQRDAVAGLISSISQIVSDKEIENGIPQDAKALAGDILMEAMSMYGFLGADKLKQAFRDGLLRCPTLRKMVPIGVL